jgi:PAS domain S-box-containing protein
MKFSAKLVTILLVILLMGNLNALVGHFLHPAIPYFHKEHLIEGAVSALVTTLLIIMVGLYIKTMRDNEREIQKLNSGLAEKIGELQTANEQLSLILENLPIIPYTCKAEGDYGATFIGDSVTRVAGYKHEHFTANPSFWADNIHPDDKLRVFEGLHSLSEMGESTSEYRWKIADGTYRWFGDMSRLIKAHEGNPGHIVGAWRDITERKQAEETLKLQSGVARNMSEGVDIVRESDSVIVYANPKFEEIFGYDSGELIGKHVSVLNAPSYKNPEERAKEIIEAVKEKGLWEGEIRNIRKDGTEFWTYASISRFNDPQHGKALIATQLDITRRKEVEEALHLSEERFRSIVTTSQEWIWAIDSSGYHSFSNPAIEKILGYNPDEIVGHDAFDFLDEEDWPKVKQLLPRCIEQKTGWSNVVLRWKHKDGTYRYLESNAVPILDGRGVLVGFQGSDRDITERKRMEQESLKMEKLESLGQLAGGLAHDFNNLLTSIVGNVSLAKMFAEQGEDVMEILTEAEHASSRARDLTHQLLTFSKGGAPIKKTESIAALVRESSTFALRGSNVRFDLSISRDLWSAEVDQGQISQVIHNLVINAQQSMPEGGLIRITCENIRLGEADHIPLEQGRYIRISITDQGHGIPEERLAKIFDPYFTTKQKGSGLGLATAYSIIQRHNGFITANSQIGEGATFTIYLPASHEKPITRKEWEEEVLHGHGRILVMDDEEMVRAISARMLSSLGYETELAKDGEEAIDLYRDALESGNPFDAVIMDLTIPGGMGGKEAIKRLRDFDGDVVAIVSSGYSTDPIMSEYEKYGFRGVMAKPYKLKEMSRILHDLLTGRENA